MCCEIEIKPIEKSKKLKPKLHPNLYSRTQAFTKYVVDGKGQDLEEKAITYEEFDTNLKSWVTVKKETVSKPILETGEFFKSIDFILCYPAENTEDRVRGKPIKKEPKFIAQKGTLSIRPEFTHFYIRKGQIKPTDYGALRQNVLFIRELPIGVCFKRLTNGVNDQVSICTLGTETEVSLAQIGEMERLGGYMIYYPKATYDENEGTYQYWNDAGSKHITSASR